MQSHVDEAGGLELEIYGESPLSLKQLNKDAPHEDDSAYVDEIQTCDKKPSKTEAEQEAPTEKKKEKKDSKKAQ